MKYRLCLLLSVIITLSIPATVHADRMPRVFHVAQTQNADDANPGTSSSPFRTINKAAQLALPGDTVMVHEGVYREWVRPDRGGESPTRMIQYQAAPGERVCIRGSEIFDPKWEVIAPDVPRLNEFVQATIPETLFEDNPRLPGEQKYNPFDTAVQATLYRTPEERFAKRTPKDAIPELVIGEVFLHGQPLTQVRTVEETRARRGRWCVKADGRTLVVHFPKWCKGPVELTVRHQVFAPVLRGLGYIRVSGFIIEQAANQGPFPQAGMLSTRSGHHWIIENNVIRHAATVGLDAGSEVLAHWQHLYNSDVKEGPWVSLEAQPTHEKKFPHSPRPAGYNFVDADSPSKGHIIRNNVVSDNGMVGLMAGKADDLLIEGNVFERNNRRFLDPLENPQIGWHETAGMKFHLTRNAVIRSNLVRDNYGEARGIYLDNNNDNARVTRNIVLNNHYGIDLEINAGPACLVDNNIIAFSRLDGISSRDSDTMRLVHNLVMYSGRWGCILDYSGQRGPYFHRSHHRPHHCEVRNNIFLQNQGGAIRIPLPGKDTPNTNVVDGNLVSVGQAFHLCPTGLKDIPEALYAWTNQTLTKANVPLKERPDQEAWSKKDPWWRGQCSRRAFEALLGTGKNIERPLSPSKLFDLLDCFRNAPPGLTPKQVNLQELPPELLLQANWNEWNSIRVRRVADIRTDYLGQAMPDKAVSPGPIQVVPAKDESGLTVWPQQSVPSMQTKSNQ